ncbi:MAG: hypothetical protein A3I05_08885 [Deltaproteobacteria bacterium RIFCSPLOWO2_02_FULL_44_10]|nr:MAG: hypothetical protein A3C46_08730 [Deltaproteobacteria bacterium RIFCSPHIGHO2_02_FULL_44_16]OGQ45222.1 MAG: hypothetical protein A3I05_08885 [Deltaproteobacteria bacterium RIFCSPLOWO2_02_FULL_44_10]
MPDTFWHDVNAKKCLALLLVCGPCSPKEVSGIFWSNTMTRNLPDTFWLAKALMSELDFLLSDR